MGGIAVISQRGQSACLDGRGWSGYCERLFRQESLHWTESGQVVSTSPSYTLTMPSANVTPVALGR
jgi:hypothetical protein